MTVKKGMQIAKMELLDEICTEGILTASASGSEASTQDKELLWEMVPRVGDHSLLLIRKSCIVFCWSTVMYFLSRMQS